MKTLAKKTGSVPGDVVRYVPAPEPGVAVAGIAALAFLEVVFAGLFMGGLAGAGLAFFLVGLAVALIGLAFLVALLWGVLRVSGSDVSLGGVAGGLVGTAIFLILLAGPVYLAGLDAGNSVEQQQRLAFWLGSALLTLAAILSLYRKFFLPDVMIVKKRKLKYEDLM